MTKTVLTGIKSTGHIHLGNMLGAIKPAIEMSKSGKADRYLYFIADYHALTSVKNPNDFKESVYEVTAAWLALGLDPTKSILYRQSDVPEIFELAWMLSCITPKGDLNRAHSYKARIQENEEKGQKDLDHGINMGLFNYPILMASDILLFNSTEVPVGKDQVQHVEIARAIASRFNAHFGETITEPQEVIPKDGGAYVPGMDGRKMSKSYDNGIPVFVPEKKLRKLCMKITTDSSAPEDPKNPNDSLVMDFYKLFASDEQISALSDRYKSGIGWGEAKQELFEVINTELSEPREKFNELMSNTDELDKVLADGAKRARAIANENMIKIRKAMTGF